jgi:hypothetical protein
MFLIFKHKATVAEADKGKTMVIIYSQDLDKKVNSFIKSNHITELKMDPTQKMQRKTQNVLRQCKNIIDPTKRKYIIQMNQQESSTTSYKQHLCAYT